MSFSSTPVLVVFVAELVSLDWEFAYWFPNPGQLRRVKVMIVANTGRIIHCFALQNCIWNLIHNICHTIYIYPSL